MLPDFMLKFHGNFHAAIHSTSVDDIKGSISPLKTMRSNPEIVPLTLLENLFINAFMGHLFLLFDGLFVFHLASKKGGSCHLFFLGCGRLARLRLLPYTFNFKNSFLSLNNSSAAMTHR